MHDTLSNLLDLSIVLKAEQLFLDQNDKSVVQANLKMNNLLYLQANSNLLNIYKFTYLSNNHNVIGFLVQPKSFQESQTKEPCIIYNRGGSQGFGFIDQVALFGQKIGGLALQGYSVMTTQYSGCGGSQGVDQFGGQDLEDVLNLKIILDQLVLIDSSNIGMYGHSRGGLMTYMCLAQVNWIKAAVAGAAPSDMSTQIVQRPDLKIKTATMFNTPMAKLKINSFPFPKNTSFGTDERNNCLRAEHKKA